MFIITPSVSPVIDQNFLDSFEDLFSSAMKCGITTKTEGPGIEIEVDYNTNTLTSFSYFISVNIPGVFGVAL